MAVSGGTKSWSRLEPGKMPAWKLEVLERKRQKMASSGGSGVLSSRGMDMSPSRQSRKGSPERLVLQDSLGPLHENPFIKLEKERRRRRPQHPHPHPSGRATSPIRHLLDIYSNVPGIRTIRAENIIIIESDPGYFSHASHATGADPVEELLAKRGSKVAEIRASEVVIYEPEPPEKQPAKKPQAVPKKDSLDHNEVLEEAGRVSRLLEKFDHGHSRPIRSRSWENLLERDTKPALLPKPVPVERPSHVPQSMAPKRSGEISPSSASILEEDSKRFPLNNPSWLPSKPPAVHSLPDPGLFHRRPPSPVTPPATMVPGSSPTSPAPMSPRYEMTTDEKAVSPIVATVREKFEVGYTNHHPLSKLMNVAQKTGSNTMVVNPKAASVSKARPSDATVGVTVKTSQPLTNGHLDPSEINSKPNSTIMIQDLLSKSKRPRGTATRRSSEGSGVVPSPVYDSTSELPKGANNWRPKSEVNPPKNSIPPLSSASHSENSFHNHCDNSFVSATPSQFMKASFSTSTNDSFEIRPAPKPDLSKIPDDDIQAKALANIRMQSKNSFVFVPKKRQSPSAPVTDQVSTKDKPKVQVSASTFNGPKLDSTDAPGENGARVKEVFVPVNGDERIEQVPSSVTVKSSSIPSLSDFDWKSGLLPSKSTESQSFTDVGAQLEYISSVQQGDSVEILTVPVTKIHEDVAKLDIPITNIDDIVNIDDRELNKEAKLASEVTMDPAPAPYRPHASKSFVHSKGTNTFTVVPSRKPITEREAFRTPVADEEDDEDTSSKRKSSDGLEAPFSGIGAQLKKKYPTADQIRVIGGYQSLSKSCLLKNGSTRKKMKISFNEQNIHTMFEYPSENSLAEEATEEDENEVSGSESEEEEKPSSRFPRVAFASTGATTNGLQAKSNSGLSTYTPKHSVEYSKWQDEKTQERAASPDGGDNEDMLTPDYGNSHSDFRSDSALYF